MKKPAPDVMLSRADAAKFLVAHLGLRRRIPLAKGRGVVATLQRLAMIQLDPLDPMGQNADLVLLARVRGVKRGDVFRILYPGHAFEHFAKERCLLPAEALPYYRDRALAAPWWRNQERLRRLDPKTIERVLEDVRANGPVSASDLEHGVVKPLNWSGWKGTSRAATMALEVLWTQCRVVVCGRSGRGKIYDIPERALPRADVPERLSYERWALPARIRAAGLLPTRGGPWWTTLEHVRKDARFERFVEPGQIVRVAVEGSVRSYLAAPHDLERKPPRDDGEMRIIGPLDPLLWDRELVRDVFGFSYVWEVYKPAEKRIFGWYVCPLLHRGRLVGRLLGALESGVLNIRRVWAESTGAVEREALRDCIERHAKACEAHDFVLPKRIEANPKGA